MSKLLGQVIIQFLLVVNEILTIWTRNKPCLTIFAASSCISAFMHISTVHTLHFLVSIQRRHLKMGDFLTMEIKILLLGTYHKGRFELSQKIIQ